MLFSSTSVLAEEQFYRLELGVQAGAAYYMGELAPYAFMSTSETYGVQVRVKFDPRWALQAKGQRQRVINTLDVDNSYNLPAGRYQTPMWHFDITAEYHFFRFGTLSEYNVNMHPVTPFIFLGVGMTAYNPVALRSTGYPPLGWQKKTNPVTQKEQWEYSEPNFAMYIPVGVGLKWKFAERWQLQIAWQHQIYVCNGDGLEGKYVPGALNNPLDNSYQINGSNILNNDVTSTLTVGLVFEFAHDKKICLHCREKL